MKSSKKAPPMKAGKKAGSAKKPMPAKFTAKGRIAKMEKGDAAC